MPLVAHSQLPSFTRLRQTGLEVLKAERATHQDVRELHIGLLNMMPDAALEATERQFMRLIGSCNRIAQFYVHPFTIEGVEREGAAAEHVEKYYEEFRDLRRDGLDALIITGANVTEADITQERFWEPMTEVMDWARENVTSTLCSCLASHGAFMHYHDILRTHLEQKQWGVYSHRVVDGSHPLLSNINTRFDTPHSRFNDVGREQMEAAGLKALVVSKQAGVLLAVSADGLRFVYFQGHPEYDIISLMKEYKREISRYLQRDREEYPPFPDNYFCEEAQSILEKYQQDLMTANAKGESIPEFPDETIVALLDNTWTDTGKALFNNWLGLVYQLTNQNRRLPYMDGIDPNNPLGASN
jgi:homoserine O-succinyltransferase/O-acetyltransferase